MGAFIVSSSSRVTRTFPLEAYHPRGRGERLLTEVLRNPGYTLTPRPESPANRPEKEVVRTPISVERAPDDGDLGE
jgi:hypothetical protein